MLLFGLSDQYVHNQAYHLWAEWLVRLHTERRNRCLSKDFMQKFNHYLTRSAIISSETPILRQTPPTMNFLESVPAYISACRASYLIPYDNPFANFSVFLKPFQTWWAFFPFSLAQCKISFLLTNYRSRWAFFLNCWTHNCGILSS